METVPENPPVSPYILLRPFSCILLSVRRNPGLVDLMSLQNYPKMSSIFQDIELTFFPSFSLYMVSKQLKVRFMEVVLIRVTEECILCTHLV